MASERIDTRAPFTSAQARAAGLSHSDVRHGPYRQLVHGVWVSTTTRVDLVLRIRAVTTLDPACWARTHTAARLWGAPVPVRDELTMGTTGRRARVAGVATARFAEPPPLVQRKGIRLTTTPVTFAELAGELPLVDVVVAGDYLLRRALVTAAQLRLAADVLPPSRRPTAQTAADLVRRGVDSPQETRLRLLLVLAGLPEPVVNHRVVDDEGRLRRRLDLAYPHLGVAVEFDGRHHIERETQWESDLVRREDLEREGWTFIVVTGTDLMAKPGVVLDRVRRVLEAKGVPVRLDPVRWQRHFHGPVG